MCIVISSVEVIYVTGLQGFVYRDGVLFCSFSEMFGNDELCVAAGTRQGIECSGLLFSICVFGAWYGRGYVAAKLSEVVDGRVEGVDSDANIRHVLFYIAKGYVHLRYSVSHL